ncbi:MAG: SelB C-terminal domain-containing protein, partial [Chloroflexi bacterium]|nr:SelB C-terminal domain-containing protein [Chloroflexota bacterium]
VVDVPGHERFIKNKLAGVGGMDLAMQVVAADESVMPQTREHLAILDLLRVKRGVVVITKKDLVDEEWLELVKADVVKLLEGTSLEGVPAVAVSTVTGEGLEELRALLDALLAETAPRRDLGRPRLPVDRSFVMAGFGTVVTGTLTDGALVLGQEVELVPSGLRARVRGLQTHQKRIEQATPGRRVAVNLSGIEHTAIERGHVLTTPGWLEPTTVVDAQLRLIPWAPQSVRHNIGVTFHTGTSETLARVRLLDREGLKPGDEGWVQVHLEAPVAVAKGDSFVVRSPQGTLGGGVIVDPHPRRHRRFQAAALERREALGGGSPSEMLLKVVEAEGPVEFRFLVGQVNLTEEEAMPEVSRLVSEGAVVILGDKRVGPGAFFASASYWTRLKERATDALEAHHRQYSLRKGLAKEELRGRLEVAPGLFSSVLALLAQEGVLMEDGAVARSTKHQPHLTPEQEQQAQRYIVALEREPFSPPTGQAMDGELLGFLAETGRVVRVSEGVVFAASAYRAMEERIVAHLREHKTITVGEVRDMFSTSRKYALALLEHLDQRHVTRRVGDERVLVGRQTR